jgi:hypothetical protein
LNGGKDSVIVSWNDRAAAAAAGWVQFMFVWWNWLLEKDIGGLAIAALLIALAAAVMKILRDRAEIRKLSAETRKIDADARAIDRRERSPHREGVRNCAGEILKSVSALVDELYATFSLLAFPPAKVDKARLQEAVLLARRFRHEQRYRVEVEVLLAELATYAHVESEPSISRLGSQTQALLAKVSEKKAVVADIEEAGLNRDNTEAVRTWLGQVREVQIALAASVGTIVAQLALAQPGETVGERGAPPERGANRPPELNRLGSSDAIPPSTSKDAGARPPSIDRYSAGPGGSDISEETGQPADRGQALIEVPRDR